MAEPIAQQVLRNLSDRSYERRKAGAQDVEAIIVQLATAGETDAIHRLLAFLADDFISSRNIYHRKGGLAALAAAARALSSNLDRYLPTIILPILRCFEDSEGRVRYYACESLFNVAKVARSKVLRFFNPIFDGICRLVADFDTEVKTGAGVLNRKMKDIVTECEAFDVDDFVPLLRVHIASTNPHVKQLIVGWITTLDSVPEIDMLDYLPELMDGLFSMLSDGNKEVKKQVFTALCEFLKQIMEIKSEEEFGRRVKFIPIIDVLVKQTDHDDDFNRVNSMEWLCKFIMLGGNKVIVVIDRLVGAVLKCLSDSADSVVKEAAHANEALLLLVQSTSQEFPLGPVVDYIISTLSSRIQAAQLAALRWIAMLMGKCPAKLAEFYEKIRVALLQNLSEVQYYPAVVNANLDVLALIARYDPAYQRSKILPSLMALFASRRPLLETRGSYVIRKLCQLLDPQAVYLSLAEILLAMEDLEFVSLTIEILNILLLTASELVGLRDLLRGCLSEHVTSSVAASRYRKQRSSSFRMRAPSSPVVATVASEGPVPALHVPTLPALSGATSAAALVGASASASACASAGVGAAGGVVDEGSSVCSHHEQEGVAATSGRDVFVTLYATWCHSPIATFSLCLLAHAYELSCSLVSKFAETQITVGVLMQVDKLVQLIESPVFIHVRMHLLEPTRADLPYLLRSLYGLLMLLPQGPAFQILHARLASVTALHIAMANHAANSLSSTSARKAGAGLVDHTALLDHFDTLQVRQDEFAASARVAAALSHE